MIVHIVEYGSGDCMHTVSNKSWLFISILSALMAFTSLSTDIYLPAMPAMGRDLNGDFVYYRLCRLCAEFIDD